MERKELTTQIDAMLSIVKQSLTRAKKDVFSFYIKTIKPFADELLGDIKDTVEHSKLEQKLKKNSITHNLSISRFILWLGIAASVIGLLILLGFDVFVGWQLFIIPLIAILGPWFLDFFRESSEEAKDTLEGYEGRKFIGRVHRLKNPIVDGESKIVVKEVTWILKGDDCPKGSRVKIVAVSDKVLYVVGVG